MSPKEVTGDIHQKARECLKKDVRAVFLHCANVDSCLGPPQGPMPRVMVEPR